MTIQIIGIRFGGSARTHETIVAYRWVNPQTQKVDSSDKPTLVAWLDTKEAGHTAYVSDGRNTSQVGVVHHQHGQPYLRTHADGKWTDNLLALPTF